MLPCVVLPVSKNIYIFIKPSILGVHCFLKLFRIIASDSTILLDSFTKIFVF